MIRELMDLFAGVPVRGALLSYLNNSSYDELLAIDLDGNRFKFLYNIEGKYNVQTTEGGFRDYYEYVLASHVHPEDSGLYAESMDPDTLAARLRESEIPGILELQYRVRGADGEWRWLEQVIAGGSDLGIPDGLAYCYVYDIQNIKDREAGVSRVRARGASNRDPLTGLMRNDEYFGACERMLADRETDWLLVAIDLEQFKLFNEWYGRERGDEALARIGERLKQCAKQCDGLAGYMGNDDFCLLAPAGRVYVEELYEDVHGVIMSFGVSIGFLPSFGTSRSNGSTSILKLFDQASLACRHAKQDFKNRIRAFEPSMVNETAEDYRVLSDFQDALKNGEITFYLQPQCRASTGRVVGAESLARWIRPDGSMVSPATFVPVLERYGFISDLDKYIWRSVCRWSRRCLDRGLPLLPVSVNVSQVDIFTLNVTEHFCRLVEEFDLPRGAVKIEITESAYGEDSQKVRATVQDLREQGFTVLMDDFGSGYSSLNMLHELNFDIIKLDGHFLHMDGASDRKGMRILESIVNMTKTLTLPIIVEGVETESQKEYLMGLGCRYVQGYYFYRPMPAADFEALISDPEKVDLRGFIFKANDQFRIREFLDDAIYSDSMLNNIIGPAAIYAWNGDEVDIVRFNQQFFQAVNVPDFAERMNGIQRFMPPSDTELMRKLLAQAYEDRLNGASGVMTFFRADGGFSRFLIHFYFLNESDDGRRFYGAARDVTDITNLNQHMRLLSQYSSHSVIFFIRRGGGYVFEVAAHGLEGAMQLPRVQLEAELNDGSFFDRLLPESRDEMRNLTRNVGAEIKSFSTRFAMLAADGSPLELFVKGDYVDEEESDVRCILSIRHGDE